LHHQAICSDILQSSSIPQVSYIIITSAMSIAGRYHDANENRTGPGDSRPTAFEIIQDEGLEGKLTGKIAVVTGSSSGIGIETVRALHAAGLTVFATARKEQVLLDVLQEIEKSTPNNKSPLVPVVIDQESLASVRKGAQEILEKSGGKINLLICNAGVMATPKGKTKDGFETQFGVCHLSHFLLFSLLKSSLLAGTTPQFNSRVVTVSSIGHQRSSVNIGDYGYEEKEYEPWAAYGQAKTANIWMANEIDRRYGSRGLHALSLHPGGIETGLQKHVTNTRSQFNHPVIESYSKSPEQGAATQVYAALSHDWEGKGGRWLSNCEEWGPIGVAAGVDIGGFRIGDDGYAPWAFDLKGARQLWEDSCKMVGVEDD
jgi:NAD(P)-dependent dehydrogenase (short-subunit alcohol dehydrogenase family)